MDTRIGNYMMSELVTFPHDMEIVKATKMLLDKHISGAPVVDEKGALVGVLSKKDCLRAALNASYYQEWGGAVHEFMAHPVETLEADMDLIQAAEVFLKSNFRRFPVLRDGVLVGQLSRADLLKALVENWD